METMDFFQNDMISLYFCSERKRFVLDLNCWETTEHIQVFPTRYCFRKTVERLRRYSEKTNYGLNYELDSISIIYISRYIYLYIFLSLDIYIYISLYIYIYLY